MKSPLKPRNRYLPWILVGGLLLSLASLGCSGNRRVSVGGSVHMSSGGGWGHSIGIGVQSHGRRR